MLLRQAQEGHLRALFFVWEKWMKMVSRDTQRVWHEHQLKNPLGSLDIPPFCLKSQSQNGHSHLLNLFKPDHDHLKPDADWKPETTRTEGQELEDKWEEIEGLTEEAHWGKECVEHSTPCHLTPPPLTTHESPNPNECTSCPPTPPAMPPLSATTSHPLPWPNKTHCCHHPDPIMWLLRCSPPPWLIQANPSTTSTNPSRPPLSLDEYASHLPTTPFTAPLPPAHNPGRTIEPATPPFWQPPPPSHTHQPGPMNPPVAQSRHPNPPPPRAPFPG